jgi:hypothetical protein
MTLQPGRPGEGADSAICTAASHPTLDLAIDITNQIVLCTKLKLTNCAPTLAPPWPGFLIPGVFDSRVRACAPFPCNESGIS